LKSIIPERELKRISNQLRLHDPGAEELTIDLVDELGCIACLCSFSKLIIDANKSLIADEIYTIKKELKETELCIGERATSYYGLYYEIVREILELIRPKFHISVHTRPKLNNNDLEILYKGDNMIAKEFVESLRKKGVKSDCKESIEFDMGINRSIELAFYPDCIIKSFRINILEEIATNNSKRKGLITDICSVSSNLLI